MSMTKRMQGRPPRNSGANGREKLIEATRKYLQSNRKVSLTRTEIAQGCGVTPALISYYFKDKQSLLNAVTKPLLRAYGDQLSTISTSDGDDAAKMVDVIRLLLEINARDAFLVDYVWREASHHHLDAEDQTTVDAFHATITGLVRDLVQRGAWSPLDPTLIEIALWGICRALGQTMDAIDDPAGAAERASIDGRVAFVFEAFAASRDPSRARF